MAAMKFFEAFESAWAQDGDVVGWEKAQYRQGWSTIGDRKPSVEQFNNTHQIIDQKANYLFKQLKTAADDRGVATEANKDDSLKELLDGLQTSILSAAFPVGRVWISYDATNPGDFLPGVWQKISEGFLYPHGAEGAGAAGSTGGSVTKTLTESNLPSHTHTMDSAGAHTHTAQSAGAHTHTRGTMNITGKAEWRAGTQRGNTQIFAPTGAFSRSLVGPNEDASGAGGDRVTRERLSFDASKSWTGSTSNAGSHTHTTNSKGNHTHTINSTGDGTAFSIMPPRVTVYMFRRVS